jgi:hypothetical protein
MMKYPKQSSSIGPDEKRPATVKPSQMNFVVETESKVNSDLLLRLATGKKEPIDKKEMKKLTQKNYHNLPEIKKKKEDEKK